MTVETSKNGKMDLYKTAYSPLHEKYVKIVNVCSVDDQGLIVECLMDGLVMYFRDYELTDYVL